MIRSFALLKKGHLQFYKEESIEIQISCHRDGDLPSLFGYYIEYYMYYEKGGLLHRIKKPAAVLNGLEKDRYFEYGIRVKSPPP